ncbi:MAG: AAA family ATPase [Sinobacteraceae bacterium]|nr:AAA family ATPase [Nevskiaceae bacterium]
MQTNVVPLQREEAGGSNPGRDLRAEIAALQSADAKLTQSEIARQSGVNQARLNQWLRGVYAGDNAAVEAELARWLDAYRSRSHAARRMPPAPAWVPTPSGERVLAALGYAQLAGDIAVIYGGAGTGKTWTARHHQATSPNVWVATVSPSCSGLVPALEAVAAAVGVDEVNGARKLSEAIKRRLRGTQGLLVIDDAQALGIAALDELRSIHDATGVGLALLGNETVYARMTGGTRAAYLDRLFSRVGKRVRLLRATQADVDRLAEAWRVAADCKAVLREIAAQPGGLRLVTKVLRLATMTAEGERASREDLVAAWRSLGSDA